MATNCYGIQKGLTVILDKLLVWRLRRGSQEALSRIYEAYRDDLLRIAAALLNNTSDAEDIVHDVFADFFRSANRFRLMGSLKGYLTTCVANRARNANRGIRLRNGACFDDVAPIESAQNRPDQWIICTEEFAKLKRALENIPCEQKEAITLHLYGEMKFKDIAILQNTSVKTVHSRYRYGLRKLRSILDGEVTL